MRVDGLQEEPNKDSTKKERKQARTEDQEKVKHEGRTGIKVL